MRLYRSYCSLLAQKVSIPSGLRLIPNFLPELESQNWAARLDHEIITAAAELPPERATTYLSKQHNLKNSEYFKRINLNNFDSPKVLHCQHFEKYGEDGHKLTYFIGNHNIPTFIEANLIGALRNLPEVKQLSKHRDLNWNFTFNVYRSSPNKPSTVPGFPFHTDIPSNGVITFIYPLISSATLEMKRELPEYHLQQQHTHRSAAEPVTRTDQDSLLTFTTELPAGALLMFSGVSRWDWQHRILPQEASVAQDEESKVWRMSLVLGCQ